MHHGRPWERLKNTFARKGGILLLKPVVNYSDAIDIYFFCMLTIPSVWMDCLSRRFRICSLYVLLVFKRSAMMLTNCIHRYVLFIARLKGIYTYYEENVEKNYHTLWTWKSIACICYRHCNMTVYIDLMRMKKKRTHSWFTFSVISFVAYLLTHVFFTAALLYPSVP